MPGPGMFRQLPGGEFWKQVATLLSGSLLGRLITVLTMPVLTRLYAPEYFGVSAIFFAAIFVAVVIANGGYEFAIMLPKKDGDAHLLLLLCLGLSLLVGLLLMLPAVFPPGWILRALSMEALEGWHILIPFSLSLEGFIQALQVAQNRFRRYRNISASRILRSSVNVILAIALGMSGWGFEGLILGFLAGQLAGFTLLAVSYFGKTHPLNGLSLRGIRQLATEYRDFGRYGLGSNLLHNASRYLPFFLLPFYFSLDTNGQFSQADKLLALPVTLISMSVGGVFYEHATRAWRESASALRQITRNTFFKLLGMAVPFLLIVLIWGPEIFAFVLGREWALAGEYARWLMPWMFLAFISSPLAYLIDLRRKLKEFFIYNFLLFACRLLALLWAGSHLDSLQTVQLFGAVSAVLVLIQLIYLLHIGKFWGRSQPA